ncbi:hypothetical protein KI688_006583 [Linnemannia hyalina]|uniref:WD40 repeat-like protein n=1 Tax=Linnemannia hyalina TaxID=64524 RepID=A0A9P7XMJ2_9FUNG|nr:hypothetical protein KI688_006583 [Linnemannia hyalina]
MNNNPLEQLDLQVPGTDQPDTTQPERKRDKIRKFFSKSKSKSKKALSQTSSAQYASQQQPATRTSVASQASIDLSPTPLTLDHIRIDIFAENVPKPILKAELPSLQDRIERTDQLLYCNALLLQSESALLATTTCEEANDDSANVLEEQGLDKTQLDWLAATKADPMQEDHIRSLVVRMVETFVSDASKNSTKIAEIVALGPILQKEDYRKLLSSIIKEFDDSPLLDVNLLQGLVQLVQAASPEYLVSDDLIRILSILRIRLQGTHQQTSEHPYHLTLAVSRVLEVMADNKVQDLDRVIEHEPLSAVLQSLKDTTDPYLLYQACYAYQALQYVPDDETVLQAVLRHTTGVVDGLIKVSGVVKLDLGAVLDGLCSLQEAFVKAMEIAGLTYEGVCSLLESSRGVFVSLKEGLSAGQKRAWYPAVRAAYALAEAGQLKDLNQFIYRAPCHHDPMFQWGICQLLGDIAANPVWSVDIRLQAIRLLGHLYQNDQEWAEDQSVKIWMLTIIDRLGNPYDQAISTSACSLLQDLASDATLSMRHPYPLMARLLIPDPSPVLAKVQQLSCFERELHLMKNQLLKMRRLEEATQPVYISPMAKASLQALDNDVFPLIDKVQGFLASDRRVMLIMGDSGSGKSTFNKHLESELLRSYRSGGRIPLFINLPLLQRPKKELIAEQLRTHRFSDSQIEEMELHRQFVLICDGYDESQLKSNLHTTNDLNRYGQRDAKLIITCRTLRLSPDYRDLFAPQGVGHYARRTLDFYEEAVIAPFSKVQIESYVDQYVRLKPRTWTTHEYMDKLTTIPNLLDLVRNPFLLSLSLEALPGVTKGKQDLLTIRITRIHLYDKFVHHWMDVNKQRLQGNTLSEEDSVALEQLKEADFISMGIDYSTRLAAAIFEMQDGKPVVKYIDIKDRNTWKVQFFGQDSEVRLLRESSPLIRTGTLYRFLHQSMLEYFLSCAVFDPIQQGDDKEFVPQQGFGSPNVQPLDPKSPLFKRSLIAEPSIIQFLCERVQQHPDFERQLHSLIEQSKTDPTVSVAAANAITILVSAGARFNGADLRGVSILGADLSGGQFDSAQFQGADLRDVILAKSWLRKADLSNARMDGVRFGELPYLESLKYPFSCCAFQLGETVVAVGSDEGHINFYDSTSWIKLRTIQQSQQSWVLGIDFSLDGKRLATRDQAGKVRVLDLRSDENVVVVMEGHVEGVTSVALSPCGKQVALANDEGAMCLWNIESGNVDFALKGHTSSVWSVMYSPDGEQLVSGSGDKTIRFWDPITGISSTVLQSPDEVSCLALSRNGRTIASGGFGGNIQLWDAISGEPGTVFRGHTSTVTCVKFSEDGQRIASSSCDRSVRLWDAATSMPISVLGNHNDVVYGLSFSPNDQQVNSVGGDSKVRLWDVDVTRSTSEPQGHAGNILSVSYSADGRSIFSASRDKSVRHWSSTTGSTGIIRLEVTDWSVVAFSFDATQIATGGQNGIIRLWNCQTEAAEGMMQGPTGSVQSLVYSPCGRWILSSSLTMDVGPKSSYRYPTARLWNLEKAQQECTLPDLLIDGRCSPYFTAFTSTGSLLAIGDFDGIVSLYDTHTKARVKVISIEEYALYAVAFSPSGKQLAICSLASVYLWDLQSEQPTLKLDYHVFRGLSLCLSYSPCGKWLASGCDKNTLGLWRRDASETESWSCVTEVREFSGFVGCIAWNPTGTLEFVTGSDDHAVRVWRISDDNGSASVRLIWGSDAGFLCLSGVISASAIGLSAVNQQLLIQRRTVDVSSALEEDKGTIEE